jgi:hypothetical protein
MPEISRFFGIVIGIFYDDHNPPHFHAKYQRYKATIDINNLTIIQGKLPPRVFGLVVEWVTMHKKELLKNWKLARAQKPLRPIEPLC